MILRVPLKRHLFLLTKIGIMKEKQSFFYKNGLSIVMFALFLIFLSGQFITGWHVKNEELMENQKPALSLFQYFSSPHFIESMFENWESEFLQMCLYVLLTVILRQKGSSESKDLEEKEEVDREPENRPGAPWPVRKGGAWFAFYKHSLSIVFALLFFASFLFHFIGSLENFNEEQLEKSLPTESWEKYISSSQFWFESFQNWQSEFLAVGALVLLSIWLREKGSPQSKPVDTPYGEIE